MKKKKNNTNEEHVMDPIVFLNAIEALSKDKNIEKSIIIEAMQNGFAAAYRQNYNSNANVEVNIDMNTGYLTVKAYRVVVEELEDEETEILLEEAMETIPDITIGEKIYEEVTPSDFGRVAIANAKQVVVQKIKEAEKESIISEFGNKEHELLLGQVFREDENNFYIDLGRIHGLLPKNELMGNEKIVMGTSIKVFVSKIETAGKSPLILLSRKHYGFVKKLLELEIPEVASGEIIVHSVAREAGYRTKIAVSSTIEQLDPVGTCIGEKGTRIERVIKELNGEKIDVIKYDDDKAKFVENALSPAKVIKIVIEDETKSEIIAVVDQDNFSLAIGKMGQNVKLAARLTRCRIDVKTLDKFCNNEEN